MSKQCIELAEASGISVYILSFFEKAMELIARFTLISDYAWAINSIAFAKKLTAQLVLLRKPIAKLFGCETNGHFLSIPSNMSIRAIFYSFRHCDLPERKKSDFFSIFSSRGYCRRILDTLNSFCFF